MITKDGSTTIHLIDWNETYHSKFGAIQEANHVFIKSGFELINTNTVSILEIGFGTGLNALITFKEAIKTNQSIQYVGVEAYPVAVNEALMMNYVDQLQDQSLVTVFESMHNSKWEQKVILSDHFTITKRKQFFQDIEDENAFNLIYFDAFGFRVQPELWSLDIFKKMYKALKTDGILVTYACRTSIKMALIESGFTVEKLPGAPGKREMLRATKRM